MNKKLTNKTVWVLLFTALTLATAHTQAARKAGAGGGGSTTEAATTVDPPEFYWASFNHIDRQLRLQGKDLVSGDSSAPVFPQLFIGGEPVLIDPVASADATDFSTNIGAVLVPFANILDALGATAPPLGLKILGGGDNYEIKAVAGGGTALLSAYFPATLKELPADTGACPCSSDFNSFYQRDEAASPDAILCSATEAIDTDEYIEAGYGKPDGTAVLMGSHRSWSSEPLYTSSCYVRDLSQVINGVEEPQYLAAPQPVGNADHLLCVEQIKLLEPNCVP